MSLDIVLKQIEAFNAKDVEGVLDCYTDSLEIILLPSNQILFSGKEALRQHLEKDFSEISEMNSKIIESSQEQLSDGSTLLTTREEKTVDGKITNLLFIYNVKDDLITKAWGVILV